MSQSTLSHKFGGGPEPERHPSPPWPLTRLAAELRLGEVAHRLIITAKNKDFPSAGALLAVAGWHPQRPTPCQPVPIQEEQ